MNFIKFIWKMYNISVSLWEEEYQLILNTAYIFYSMTYVTPFTHQHAHGSHSHGLVLQLRTVSHLHSGIESVDAQSDGLDHDFSPALKPPSPPTQRGLMKTLSTAPARFSLFTQLSLTWACAFFNCCSVICPFWSIIFSMRWFTWCSRFISFS